MCGLQVARLVYLPAELDELVCKYQLVAILGRESGHEARVKHLISAGVLSEYGGPFGHQFGEAKHAYSAEGVVLCLRRHLRLLTQGGAGLSSGNGAGVLRQGWGQGGAMESPKPLGPGSLVAIC